ncbi:hypothetical protein BJ138DRAFT_1111952 [Hygrophoropsis aurantiaca]|uniref:Uncharacterized protein n=1 Tax=Hygrophoropsis aurantiaca TaxID=72124 RepID=A0ACB8AH93_9AGAM|nr:hypothetical protein BJ138DRAFT_1111952 [Hygrophoropsis aurantiaca]
MHAFQSLLALAFLTTSLPAALGSVYVTNPVQATTCHGGQACTVQWVDNGETPLLSSIGECTVGLYNGELALVQSLQSVDVSTSQSFQFTPNPSAGANGGYYVVFTSNSISYQGFSATFTLDGMTGSAGSGTGTSSSAPSSSGAAGNTTSTGGSASGTGSASGSGTGSATGSGSASGGETTSVAGSSVATSSAPATTFVVTTSGGSTLTIPPSSSATGTTSRTTGSSGAPTPSTGAASSIGASSSFCVAALLTFAGIFAQL